MTRGPQACPHCHGFVDQDGDELYCRQCARRFYPRAAEQLPQRHKARPHFAALPLAEQLKRAQAQEVHINDMLRTFEDCPLSRQTRSFNDRVYRLRSKLKEHKEYIAALEQHQVLEVTL